MGENETIDTVIQKNEEASVKIDTVYASLFLKQSQKLRREGMKSGIIAILKVIKNMCDADKTDEEILNDIRAFVNTMLVNPTYGKQHPNTDDDIDITEERREENGEYEHLSDA